jgi:hypothetical protein
MKRNAAHQPTRSEHCHCLRWIAGLFEREDTPPPVRHAIYMQQGVAYREGYI